MFIALAIFAGLLFIARKDRQHDNAFEQSLKELECIHRAAVYGEEP